MTGDPGGDPPRADGLGDLRRAVSHEDADPFIGTVLRGWRISDLLGCGGFGRVYRAERDGTRAALKILISTQATVAGAARERFVRSCRLAARITHPGIVRVLDGWVEGDQPFLAMELVEGPSLAARLAEGGPLGLDEARAVVRDLAGALGHLHDQGLLHRDVKPSNVLCPADGGVKLTDFDLLRPAASDGAVPSLTRTGTAIGTAAYMAPEQLRGVGIDARSDVYALGAVFYEMLAGEPPHGRGAIVDLAAAVLTHDPPPIEARVPGLDRATAQLIGAMIARDPATRPATMADVLGRLDGGPAPSTPTAPTAMATVSGASSGRRRPRRSGRTTRPSGRRTSGRVRGDSVRVSNQGPAVSVAVVALPLLAVIAVGGLFVIGRRGAPGEARPDDTVAVAVAEPRPTLGPEVEAEPQPAVEPEVGPEIEVEPAPAVETEPAVEPEPDPARATSAPVEPEAPATTNETPPGAADPIDPIDEACEATVLGARILAALRARDVAAARAVLPEGAPPGGPLAAASARWSAIADDLDAVLGRAGEHLIGIEVRRGALVFKVKEATAEGLLLRSASGAEMDVTVASVLDGLGPGQLVKLQGRDEDREAGARRAATAWLLLGDPSLADHRRAVATALARAARRGVPPEALERLATAWSEAIPPPETDVLADASRDPSPPDDRRIDPKDPPTPRSPFKGPRLVIDGGRRAVAFDPTSRLLCGTDESRRNLVVWSLATGEVVASWRSHEDLVDAVAWDPKGRLIASGSKDETVVVRRAHDGEVAYRFDHGSQVYSVAFSPDGTRLAATGVGGVIRVWSLRDGRAELELRGHGDTAYSVAWHPDGTMIGSASDDGTARFWDARDGRALRTHDDEGIPNAIAWSRDGRRLLLGGFTNQIFSWPELRRFGDRFSPIEKSTAWSAAWSADGRFVALAGNGATAEVFDAATRRPLAQIRGSGDFRTVAWSADGALIAAAGSDEIIVERVAELLR